MKNEAVEMYRLAAEIMDRPDKYGTGCCFAISRADITKLDISDCRKTVHPYESLEMQPFKEMFAPDQCNTMHWWPCDKEHQQVRVIALCFAAAMAEAGDL